nr:tail fiber protein [uncultured Chitinophaga sp.]
MPYIGEIRLFTGDFPPRGWAFCDGSRMQISMNSALFAILSVTYGGDGRSYFNLPDLRGRVPLQANNAYQPGQLLGTESVTLLANQLPAHVHNISGSLYQPVLGENPGQLLSPDNTNMAITPGQQVYSTVKHATNRMAPLKTSIQVQNTGSNQPMENRQPYMALHYIICLSGDFPSKP